MLHRAAPFGRGVKNFPVKAKLSMSADANAIGVHVVRSNFVVLVMLQCINA